MYKLNILYPQFVFRPCYTRHFIFKFATSNTTTLQKKNCCVIFSFRTSPRRKIPLRVSVKVETSNFRNATRPIAACNTPLQLVSKFSEKQFKVGLILEGGLV